MEIVQWIPIKNAPAPLFIPSLDFLAFIANFKGMNIPIHIKNTGLYDGTYVVDIETTTLSPGRPSKFYSCVLNRQFQGLPLKNGIIESYIPNPKNTPSSPGSILHQQQPPLKDSPPLETSKNTIQLENKNNSSLLIPVNAQNKKKYQQMNQDQEPQMYPAFSLSYPSTSSPPSGKSSLLLWQILVILGFIFILILCCFSSFLSSQPVEMK